MRIQTGFEIVYDCPAPVPMLLTLSVHPSRREDLETPDWIRPEPDLEVRQYLDAYGNICSRILAPQGLTTLSADFVIRDSGQVDAYVPDAPQLAAEDLSNEALVYLLGSRYCETDRLSDLAWSLFGGAPLGWTATSFANKWRSGSTSPVTASSARRCGPSTSSSDWAASMCRAWSWSASSTW